MPGGVEPVEWEMDADHRFLLGVRGQIGRPSTGLSLGVRTVEGLDIGVSTHVLEQGQDHRDEAVWMVENEVRMNGGVACMPPIPLTWRPGELIVDGVEHPGEVGERDGWWCVYAELPERVIHVTGHRRTPVPGTIRLRRVTDWTPYAVDLDEPQRPGAFDAAQARVPQDW